MNVSLTPELESLVHEKVESGLYTSASEVVREALRLLNDKDAIQQQRLAELKHESRKSLAEMLTGRTGLFESDKTKTYAKSLSELPRPGESLAEDLEGYIGVVDSSLSNEWQVSHSAENASEEFTKYLVEKKKSGHL